MTEGKLHAEFQAGSARIASMLDDAQPRMSATTNPLLEAIRAAAKAVGCTVAPGSSVQHGEAREVSIERLAHASQMLVREVVLGEQRIGEGPAPILVFRKNHHGAAQPALLIREGRRWYLADAESSWKRRRLVQPNLTQFEDKGYLLLPAFPDKVMSLRGLLSFGFRQSVGDLIGFLTFMVVIGCLVALLPIVSGPLFDSIVPEGDVGLLVNLGVFLLVLFFVNLLTRFATGVARLRLDGRVGYFLRAAAIDRAVRVADAGAQRGEALPPAPIAALSARSVEKWHRGACNMLLTVAASILMAVPSLFVIAGHSGNALLVLFATIALIVVIAIVVARRRVGALLHGLTTPQSWMSTAYEGLSMLDVIRSTASEGRLFARWTDGFLSLRHRFLRADRVGIANSALGEGIDGILVLAAVFAAALGGDLNNGTSTIALVVAAGSVAGAVNALLSAFNQVPMLGLQFRMVQPLLANVPRPALTGARPPELSGAIELEAVTCRHKTGARAALENVSFSISPGEHVGITGPSGAGKSTLINALLGLAPCASGSIRFDGIPLSHMDDRLVRRQIGIVGQGGALFPGTLYDNISSGAPLSLKEVEDAARKAGFGPDLEKLPLGLSTPVGDTECGFSGGQVQRILLARAFASKARILVLDEATCALDPDLQDQVSWAIDDMNATVISIAHRLETLKRCDRILVLDSGRLLESGTYESLLNASGTFAALVDAERAA